MHTQTDHNADMSTFAAVIRHHAETRPDAPALSFKEQTWSFSQLHDASSRAARMLQEQGVRAGDRVAVLTHNRPEYFELILACSKIGAIVAGLNWRLSPVEIAEILKGCAPALILTGETEAALLRDAQGYRVLSLDTDYPALCAAAPAEDPGHAGAPSEPVLLLYTSGTTGLPKGVILTNENMSFTYRLATESWGMSSQSVNLVAMPMFHIGGCGYGSSTFMAGGHTVLMADVDVERAVDLVARHRVTHTFLVPTVVQSLLNVPGIGDADLSSMELLMYGAAPIGDVLLSRAMEVLQCKFMHAYGMTEAAGTVVVLPPEDHALDGPKAALLKSCGRALPWVELRVIDPDTQTDAEAGKPGEIWLRSAMMTPGYWNAPAATAEAITSDGWFRTGDAAYLDAEGYVYLFDRFKDMIISGGENIYPAEIENALNAHDGLHECAVIGVPHEKWGETPLAVIVPKQGVTLCEEDIIEFCRTRLARYKCPTRVAFSDTLPRNASGKLLKHELRKSFRERADA
ncbi:long-chain-fatty-acid--CoA ligase [Sulfitobacter sp. HNIBRBA3233]|uniref:long-chain-fatty-acid--CoA ligase n=1 Tax=Sulfitobacter marinivivus TaxID=3158558 RepID=UPI0032DF0414